MRPVHFDGHLQEKLFLHREQIPRCLHGLGLHGFREISVKKYRLIIIKIKTLVKEGGTLHQKVINL